MVVVPWPILLWSFLTWLIDLERFERCDAVMSRVADSK